MADSAARTGVVASVIQSSSTSEGTSHGPAAPARTPARRGRSAFEALVVAAQRLPVVRREPGSVGGLAEVGQYRGEAIGVGVVR